MIDECFLHCKGIGPKTNSMLKESGFYTWDDCIVMGKDLPFSGKRRDYFIKELQESRQALDEGDTEFFISRMPVSEHWRILAMNYDRTTYFDIETTGLSWAYSHVSVIVAYRDSMVHTFVYGENLDDFLNFVEDSSLLVSFNGSSFDIPFIERTFNIPALGCPHVDLRWIAYHQGYRGGLKNIETSIGLFRPEGIKDIDGFEAVELFYKWQAGDGEALELLINYCTADVLATSALASTLMYERGIIEEVVDKRNFYKYVAYQK